MTRSSCRLRDKGPQKRFARDYVDARFSLGEYLMFGALMFVIISLLVPASSEQMIYVLGGFWVMFLAVFVDVFILSRKLRKRLDAKSSARWSAAPSGTAPCAPCSSAACACPSPSSSAANTPPDLPPGSNREAPGSSTAGGFVVPRRSNLARGLARAALSAGDGCFASCRLMRAAQNGPSYRNAV